MEDTLSKFMSESTKRHEENSNLIKEIRASTDAAIRNQGASIKTLEIQIGKMSKVLQERGFGSLPSSTKANPRDQVKSISTTIEADSYPIRRIRSSQYAVSAGQKRESTKRHEENSNLIKEIRASTDAAIRNQGASIKTLEIQVGQMSKVLHERGFGSLPNSTKANTRDQVKSISTTIEAD
ncbi:hypothetical protein Tco_1266337 [Tanacetum coccineum]